MLINADIPTLAPFFPAGVSCQFCGAFFWSPGFCQNLPVFGTIRKLMVNLKKHMLVSAIHVEMG